MKNDFKVINFVCAVDRIYTFVHECILIMNRPMYICMCVYVCMFCVSLIIVTKNFCNFLSNITVGVWWLESVHL
jgi:hypothetical protein